MFGVGASHLATEWHDLDLDVVGLDWRMSVQEARDKGLTKTLQEIWILRSCLPRGKSSKKGRKPFSIRACRRTGLFSTSDTGSFQK